MYKELHIISYCRVWATQDAWKDEDFGKLKECRCSVFPIHFILLNNSLDNAKYLDPIVDWGAKYVESVPSGSVKS